MDRLLDPEMHIIVDELADYHSLLLGSYKEKQTKTCCLYTQYGLGGLRLPLLHEALLASILECIACLCWLLNKVGWIPQHATLCAFGLL